MTMHSSDITPIIIKWIMHVAFILPRYPPPGAENSIDLATSHGFATSKFSSLFLPSWYPLVLYSEINCMML